MTIGTYNEEKVKAVMMGVREIYTKYAVETYDSERYREDNHSRLCKEYWDGRNFVFPRIIPSESAFLNSFFMRANHFDRVIFPKSDIGGAHIAISSYSLTNSSLEKAQNLELSVSQVMDNVKFNTEYVQFKYTNYCPKVLRNCVFPFNVSNFLYFERVLLIENVVFPRAILNRDELTIESSIVRNVDLPLNINNLIISNGELYERVKFPKVINGNFNIKKVRCFKDCTFPEKVNGKIILSVDSLENSGYSELIDELKKIDCEGVVITGLTGEIFKYVKFSKVINGDFHVNSIRCFKDCTFPEKVRGKIILHIDFSQNSGYSDLIDELKKIDCEGLIIDGIDGLMMSYAEYITRYASIKEMVQRDFAVNLCLTGDEQLENLFFPTYKFHGSIYADKLQNLPHIEFPEEVDGDLKLSNLKDATLVVFPEKVGGTLDLSSLNTLNGTTLPLKVGELILNSLTDNLIHSLPLEVEGSINLLSLKTVEYLQLPKKIGGSVNIPNLTTAGVLIFPTTMTGNINLNNLSEAETIICSQTLNGNIKLKNLQRADTILCPQKMAGDLDLCLLNKVNTLVLPDIINGDLRLNSLRSLEGVVLPKQVTGNIYVNEELSKQVDLSGICTNIHIVKPETSGITIFGRGLSILRRKLKLSTETDIAPQVDKNDFKELENELGKFVNESFDELKPIKNKKYR